MVLGGGAYLMSEVPLYSGQRTGACAGLSMQVISAEDKMYLAIHEHHRNSVFLICFAVGRPAKTSSTVKLFRI